jgi:hypothetical protein
MPLRRAWIASGAALGAVAGLPWVDILSGPLPSFVFAVCGALEARRRWNASSPSVPFVTPAAAVVGLVVGLLFGFPLSSTWPDRCFALIPGFLSLEAWQFTWSFALAGALCATVAEAELQRRAARLARLREGDRHRLVLVLAVWIGGLGLAWSLVNELLFPNVIFGLLDGKPFDEYKPRHPCNPEVGWLGAAHYALALLTIFAAQGTALPRGRAAWRARLTVATFAALLMAQTARTAWLVSHELPQLRSHGGSIECGCHKFEGFSK